MKNSHQRGEQLRPISDLSGYAIEEGDTDPRGWDVVDSGGTRVGRVSDLLVDTQAMKVRKLIVDAGGSSGAKYSAVAVDVTDVDFREHAHQVLARHYQAGSFGERAASYDYDTSTADGDQRTLTRSEEELRIGKRQVSRGEARIGKRVETERVSEPVTRRREEVVIERRPVQGGARADARIADDEVRIPLMEEEVLVEKRPVVKEELVVGKRVVEERDVVEAEVRREEFDIDTNVETSSGRRPRRRSE